MFNNNLSGQIPDSLGGMIQLQILHVKKNKLTGTIPSSLGELGYLTWIDASLNMLSGTIPASLGSRSLLKDLRLHDNRYVLPV
jgi:Leucine-rich repeat (LRR) protein